MWFLYKVLTIVMCAVSPLIKSDYAEHVNHGPGLIYPEISTIGILAAIAVPLDLIHQSVFVSFGFEEYYFLPHEYYNWFPPEDIGRNYQSKKEDGSYYRNESYKRSLDEEMMLTRRRVYTIIEDHLEFSGYDGKSCLLRTICEVNAHPLADNNGIWGSIIQIFFTPTSSEGENLDDEYYEAELNGADEICDMYYEDCPEGLLDLITRDYFLV